MQVQNATLKALLQWEKQFRVPIWQRQYAWGATQHAQIWSDIIGQYDGLIAGESALAGHFLGSFVLSPWNPSATGVQTFLVVDGQQRLTTLMIVLCALRDRADDAWTVERINELYLVNKFRNGKEHYRLRPTEGDRADYSAVVDRATGERPPSAVLDAYHFYVERLSERRPSGEPIDAATLEKVIVERMAIVEITTQQGDNAHRIFQSLNGTGVELNQADLLRNYLFMLLPTRSEIVYDSVWRPMESTLGTEHLAGLARVDLLRRGIDVRKGEVYARHQRRLDPIAYDEAQVEEQVRDLARRAEHYRHLLNPATESDPHLSAGLSRLAKWGTQTCHPILMVAYDLRSRGLLDTSGLVQVVHILESFYVRRQLARIPTNTLNRLFVQLVERLPEDAGFVDALHYELSRERRYWPDDDRLREVIRSQPFFHIGRWHQRKHVLERLERSFEHPEVVDFDESNLQIEHVMPQTLSPEWRAHLTEQGEDPDAVHDQLVHTLGNLTLTAFNGTLSNNPFERKREIYGDSHLELNRALWESKRWGEEEIVRRADALADRAAAIWLAPRLGVPSVADGGFDWSRIEAAIAQVARGRWTSYGALAELGGTAAQPVGNFVRALPAGSRAYRVLTSDGEVSEKFAWTNPDDTRDVREVLAAEGIEFQLGRASPAQHMGAEELSGLLDEEPTIDEELGD